MSTLIYLVVGINARVIREKSTLYDTEQTF